MKKAVAWILIFVGLVAQGISQSETNMAARGSAACLDRIVRAVAMLELRIPYLTRTAEESAMRYFLLDRHARNIVAHSDSPTAKTAYPFFGVGLGCRF